MEIVNLFIKIEEGSSSMLAMLATIWNSYCMFSYNSSFNHNLNCVVYTSGLNIPIFQDLLQDTGETIALKTPVDVSCII